MLYGPLDECHRAKNLFSKNGKPTKTGENVFLLQEKLPKARVVYCSATGITEPANMAYMTRLGLWGPQSPFPDGFTQFHNAVTVAGIGMMELVAMELKRQGSYICRTLSYKGAEFKTVKDAISAEDVELYDQACLVWQDLYNELKQGLYDGSLIFPLKKKKKKSNNYDDDYDDDDDDELDYYSDDDKDQDDCSPLRVSEKRKEGIIWAYYWSAHQVSNIIIKFYYYHEVYLFMLHC